MRFSRKISPESTKFFVSHNLDMEIEERGLKRSWRLINTCLFYPAYWMDGFDLEGRPIVELPLG